VKCKRKEELEPFSPKKTSKIAQLKEWTDFVEMHYKLCVVDCIFFASTLLF